MKYPIIAIEDKSFDTTEPTVLYRTKLTIQIKNLKKHILDYTYCDSNGELYKIRNFQETNEEPKLGCNPFFYHKNFKIIVLEFSATGKELSESSLRRIIRRNAEKIHFVKNENDKIELFKELDAAKTYRELIECIYAPEWTEEEEQLNREKQKHNKT